VRFFGGITNQPRRQAGFTLFELLVVIAMFALMAGLTFVNISQPQTDASIEAATSTLLADIKSQQLMAMVGDGGSDGIAEPFGIYIQANQYTLFKNATYSAGNADNFIVIITSSICPNYR
jgi:prepilin-type N-terminal cleavage/methylation domain-containing protein